MLFGSCAHLSSYGLHFYIIHIIYLFRTHNIIAQCNYGPQLACNPTFVVHKAPIAEGLMLAHSQLSIAVETSVELLWSTTLADLSCIMLLLYTLLCKMSNSCWIHSFRSRGGSFRVVQHSIQMLCSGECPHKVQKTFPFAFKAVRKQLSWSCEDLKVIILKCLRYTQAYYL